MIAPGSSRRSFLKFSAAWELKAQALKKNNLLTLHRCDECLDSLGGLANLKEFCRRALQERKRCRESIPQIDSRHLFRSLLQCALALLDKTLERAHPSVRTTRAGWRRWPGSWRRPE